MIFPMVPPRARIVSRFVFGGCHGEFGVQRYGVFCAESDSSIVKFAYYLFAYYFFSLSLRQGRKVS